MSVSVKSLSQPQSSFQMPQIVQESEITLLYRGLDKSQQHSLITSSTSETLQRIESYNASSPSSKVTDNVVDYVQRHLFTLPVSILLSAVADSWYLTGFMILANSCLIVNDYNTLDSRLNRQVDELSSLPLNESLLKIANNENHLSNEELKILINKFVQKNFQKFGLPKYCDIDANQNFLSSKMFAILSNKKDSPKIKSETCVNVISNFIRLFEDFEKRLNCDLYVCDDFKTIFNVGPQDTILSVKILGDETHNKGNVPLLIKFKSNSDEAIKKVVYKPRSTLPEEMVCGKGKGLFAALKMDSFTYHVLNREEYGYAQFLENKFDENIINDPSQLEEYARKLVFLDKLAVKLGLSDMHSGNLITSFLAPCPIDMETILLPVDALKYATGVLDGFQAGYKFDPETKNWIWIAEEEGTGVLDEGDSMNALMCAKERIRVSESEKMDAFIDSFSVQIAECRKALSKQAHRIVLIHTDELKAQFKEGLHSAENLFVRELKMGLSDWNFEADPAAESCIRAQFQEDYRNNDIPIFYFDSVSGIVSYGDIPINIPIGNGNRF
ncbi:MAG: DUF4135 domain-containing protein [Parachlamydiales bacterium]